MKSFFYRNLAVFAAALACSTSPPVYAQSNNAEEEKIAGALDQLFSEGNPAFSMLGVAPGDVQTPETPQELALGLLNGIDQNGNAVTSAAFEFTPALLFSGNTLTVKKYREMSDLQRSLVRLQIATALSKGVEDDDKSVRASIGFVWQPFNGLDPLKKGRYFDCIAKARNQIQNSANPDTDFAARDSLSAAQVACKKKNPLQLDNTFNLRLSAAPIFVSATGKTSDLKSQGYTVAANASIGLSGGKMVKPNETRGFIVLTTGYREDEAVADPDIEGAFLKRNRFYAGGRLRFGQQDRFAFGLESIYQRASYSDGRKDRYGTVIGSVDFRISPKLWLGANFGRSFGNSIVGDSTFLGSSFRYAFTRRNE